MLLQKSLKPRWHRKRTLLILSKNKGKKQINKSQKKNKKMQKCTNRDIYQNQISKITVERSDHGLTQNEHVTSANFRCENMSDTMVGPQIKFLTLDGLKRSSSAFPQLRYSEKIDNDFDQSCHGLICYYGFSI